MSAIYGIIHKNGGPVSQETAHTMASAMRHRAIDGAGSWLEGNILLGQCLLTFNAADRSWRVPLVTDDLVVVADIRIDNASYIRKLTNSPEEATDIALLVAAFRKWGQHCVYYLSGEFAFAIWEREQRCLFLATDRVGFKSLYYYDTENMFIFCTEQKGLLAVKPSPHYFNEESLIAYHFRQGDPAATHTKYVYALLGGYGLTLEEHYRIRLVRYWNPSPGKYTFDDEEECAMEMQQLLTTVVKDRISTDRPIGITLSGGLDSSSIACLLAKELAAQNRPLYAFSSVLSETAQGNDERAYIERILRHCPNIIPTFVDAPACGPFDDISDAFDRDETFPNPFFYMDHAILQAAKEKGVGVLFTGYGGDHWVSWQGHPVIYNMMAAGRYQLAYKLIMEFAEREQRHPLQIVKRELATHTSIYRALKGGTRQMLHGTALRKDLIHKYKQQIDLRPVRDVFLR
ncbi:asparagine synthase-related protein [Chitinophaga pinensis]|uniref:asparagine synthase (glutamine-hydrolyzing) n=1 Tax=Chitinophaga pinensis TaxID=79329 RepID=A0A5C6LLT4_9BACT|nr:asparagine synthase-related protein [Chitinophaga pinensis]TWV93289.1 asparagine synthetase B [Chitinophaga pinensis]